MKRFIAPLVLLVVATLVLLAGYLTGYLGREWPPANGLQVLWEPLPETDRQGVLTGLESPGEQLVVRLYEADRRTRWQAKSDRYQLDIRRRGPSVFVLDITTYQRRNGAAVARHLRTAIDLPAGNARVARYRVPGQQIVVERVEQ
ncbi:hypothetical protein A11A3_15172 [Alcanivorax hongdengensis A-11-3]|uniref:Uncharacterized protein n=1 Tax=Alcanivorax hongdengensis A-11-3 TaxID=1177179 RepID=L0WBN6_9GAMM|nr:hypothetical protein [Alcanivorax hongdengensis]EKF73155.1 hypothetical protein A11A3_15172 [Alcanivorax hongdengensis A-11-3]